MSHHPQAKKAKHQKLKRKKTEGGECKESIEGTLRKVFQLRGVSSAVETAKSSSEMWTEDLPLALIMCKSW